MRLLFPYSAHSFSSGKSQLQPSEEEMRRYGNTSCTKRWYVDCFWGRIRKVTVLNR